MRSGRGARGALEEETKRRQSPDRVAMAVPFPRWPAALAFSHWPNPLPLVPPTKPLPGADLSTSSCLKL